MQGFSGIVRISNISDFIEPSQKCVLPLQNTENLQKSSPQLVGIHAKGADKSTSAPTAGQAVKVTLSDCLACSGCITTAETMLVESQTAEQMLKGFSSHKLSVVTVSPQSLCSLAVHFGLEPWVAARRLAHFLKSLGATYILDSSFARMISRQLGYEEFRRLLHTSTLGENEQTCSNGKRRTLLTGACPGFVCYAEKTHGDLLVPLISHVRSPQAVAGLLVKDFLRRRQPHVLRPAEIFHVGVMPCYDKKLEASRADFADHEEGIAEVDCVVTASELITLISSSEEHQRLFESCTAASSSSPTALSDESAVNWLNRFETGELIGDSNCESSGGYADFVTRSLLRDFPTATLSRVQKNKDLEELHVRVPELGDEAIVIAKLYGFRNIQNAVQKLKRDKLRLDFVEVMACPSGCSNGGGQIRGESADERARISAAVNDAYAKLRVSESAEREMRQLLAEWPRLNPDFELTHLQTEYHSIRADPAKAPLMESW